MLLWPPRERHPRRWVEHPHRGSIALRSPALDHPERQTADPPSTTVDPPLGQLALWLAAWCGDGQTVVYVARNLAWARAMAPAVAALAPEAESLLFPPWDCLPYDRAQPSAAA